MPQEQTRGKGHIHHGLHMLGYATRATRKRGMEVLLLVPGKNWMGAFKLQEASLMAPEQRLGPFEYSSDTEMRKCLFEATRGFATKMF